MRRRGPDFSQAITEHEMEMVAEMIERIESHIKQTQFELAYDLVCNLMNSYPARKLRHDFLTAHKSDKQTQCNPELTTRLVKFLKSIPSAVTTADPEMKSPFAAKLFVWPLMKLYIDESWHPRIWVDAEDNCTTEGFARLLYNSPADGPKPKMEMRVRLMSEYLLGENSPPEGLAWTCRQLFEDYEVQYTNHFWKKMCRIETIPVRALELLATIAVIIQVEGRRASSIWPIFALIRQHDPTIAQQAEKLLISQILEGKSLWQSMDELTPFYQWCFAQPPLVHEFLLSKMLTSKLFNISDYIDIVGQGELPAPAEMGPLAKSLNWLASIVHSLEEKADWDPMGMYHYENTFGIWTDSGLWEIEVPEDAWSKNGVSLKVTFARHGKEGGGSESVCVDAIDKFDIPIGDRLAALVLACWNDVESAKRVDTIATVMGLPVPQKPPCPECGETREEMDYCQCEYVHQCPSCGEWRVIPGECFECRVDHH